MDGGGRWMDGLLDRAFNSQVTGTKPLQVHLPGEVGSVHTLTALLVDDEALVRMGTADMLLELGYSVIEAASGT